MSPGCQGAPGGKRQWGYAPSRICLDAVPSCRRRRQMEEHQIGWIAAIIVGGIAGWLAEQFMKSEMGLVMNIVLG